MNESTNNPPLNRLQSGVSVEELESAVRLSGYPLQRVAAELLGDSFHVTQEWAFRDRETNEHRSLDLFGFREVRKTARLRLEAALLVECKKSELPFVFFEAAAPRVPSEFPRVVGLRGERPQLHSRDGVYRTPTIAEFLGLQDFAFASDGPPICRSFTKSERKGKKLDLSGSFPFNKVVMPLASATEHFARQWNRIGSSGADFACMVHPICIVDGPMVLARGGPKSSHLELRPWIRITLQEVATEQDYGFSHHYVVDFVHCAYVSAFISEHFLPFLEQFANRAVSAEELIVQMKAEVPELHNWKFEDLRPYSKAARS